MYTTRRSGEKVDHRHGIEALSRVVLAWKAGAVSGDELLAAFIRVLDGRGGRAVTTPELLRLFAVLVDGDEPRFTLPEARVVLDLDGPPGERSSTGRPTDASTEHPEGRVRGNPGRQADHVPHRGKEHRSGRGDGRRDP